MANLFAAAAAAQGRSINRVELSCFSLCVSVSGVLIPGSASAGIRAIIWAGNCYLEIFF